MTKAHGWRYWLVLLVGLCFSHMGLAQSQGNESEDERWFTADTLNAGLGEVPEEVKRLSPREAIRSFLTLTYNCTFLRQPPSCHSPAVWHAQSGWQSDDLRAKKIKKVSQRRFHGTRYFVGLPRPVGRREI